MQVGRNARGFEVLSHTKYGCRPAEITRLVQQSSAVGDYPDAHDRSGTSALWVGQDHRLDREEVARLVAHLAVWLATGSLSLGPA